MWSLFRSIPMLPLLAILCVTTLQAGCADESVEATPAPVLEQDPQPCPPGQDCD